MEIVHDKSHNVRFRLDDGREFTLADLLADLEKVEKLETEVALTRNSREWNRKRVLELEDVLESAQSRVAELESLLAQSVGRADRLAASLAVSRGETAQSRIADLENRIKGYDHDRRTEKARAAEAESRVEVLTGQLSAAQQKAERAEGLDRDRIKNLEAALKITSDARDQWLEGCSNALATVEDLRLRLSNSVKHASGKEEWLRNEMADQDHLTARVIDLKRDLDQANRQRDQADLQYRQSIETRDNLLKQATTRVNAAQEILSDTEVTRTREQIVTRDGAFLADVIADALSALEG